MQTGLILAMPQLRAAVQAWRAAALPGARLGLAPHLTVLYPWVDREPTVQDRGRVRQAIWHLRPFTLRFCEVSMFPGFVWLRPEPAEAVATVYAAVAAAFSEFPPYAGLHPRVIPHLTVATCDPGETAALAALATAALADPSIPMLGPFDVHGVDVAMRHTEEEDFTVRRLATFGERRA